MGACNSNSNSEPNDEVKDEDVIHPLNLVVYAAGVFETKEQTTGAGTEIAQSGFTTIILWTIHVHDNGDLYYNDHLIVSNGQLNDALYGANGSSCDLKSEIASMRANSNGAIENILFCIGSGGVSDFETCSKIQQNGNFPNLISNFAVLLGLGVDGFDYDCEEWYEEKNSTLVNIIVDMVMGFKTINCKVQTFCPYDAMEQWLECLVNIYVKNNKEQLISWWNLQCYSGGAGNDPKTWIDAIVAQESKNGVRFASQFIIPGFDGQDGLAGLKSDFQQYARVVFGGFLWNYPGETSKDIALVKYRESISSALVPLVS